jgi:hypothetical protein
VQNVGSYEKKCCRALPRHYKKPYLTPQRRIENYKELQKMIEKTVAGALDQAPWTKAQKK